MPGTFPEQVTTFSEVIAYGVVAFVLALLGWLVMRGVPAVVRSVSTLSADIRTLATAVTQTTDAVEDLTERLVRIEQKVIP